MTHKTEPDEGGFFLDTDIDIEEKDYASSRKKKVCFPKKTEAIRIKIRRPKK